METASYTRTYSAMSDGELAQLVSDGRDSLNESARRALDAELLKRGLSDNALAKEYPSAKSLKAGAEVEGSGTFTLLKGGSKATRGEELKERHGKWIYYLAIPFITLLHILVPHGEGEAAESAVIGSVLMAIAIAWYEVLPRVKKRREQNHPPTH